MADPLRHRIDSIVIYNRLSRKDVRSIVDVRIGEIQKRLHANGKDITLQLSTEALDFLGAVGYHPSYGARPLNRAIQTELLNPLSSLIISEAIRDGEVAKVEWDPKANRLVVIPNHEAIAMDIDEESDEDEDAIEVEELD